MGRDIHYCECGEEIFDEMETCWKCNFKTERRTTSEMCFTDWFSSRDRSVDHRAYAYGMFSGAMAAVSVFAALRTSVALLALAVLLGIIGEAFRRTCPLK